jgi:hypothetical protein
MPPAPPEDDDDFELELEPVDPEILETERQRAQRKTDEVVTKATFEELQQLRPQHHDYDLDLSTLRQFRFTTRHLLIFTAILAIGLALKELMGGCMSLFVMSLTAICAGWFAVYRTERRQALELARQREKFLASRGPSGASPTAGDEGLASAPSTPREFRFAFSLKQMLITIAAAAVFLTIVRLFGPKALTMTLGIIALVGLAVQTFGLFDPPPAVVFAWWILLMLYLALGLLTAFFPALMGASRAPDDHSPAAASGWC